MNRLASDSEEQLFFQKWQRFHGILGLVLSNALYEEFHLFFVYLSVIVYINLAEQPV